MRGSLNFPDMVSIRLYAGRFQTCRKRRLGMRGLKSSDLYAENLKLLFQLLHKAVWRMDAFQCRAAATGAADTVADIGTIQAESNVGYKNKTLFKRR